MKPKGNLFCLYFYGLVMLSDFSLADSESYFRNLTATYTSATSIHLQWHQAGNASVAPVVEIGVTVADEPCDKLKGVLRTSVMATSGTYYCTLWDKDSRQNATVCVRDPDSDQAWYNTWETAPVSAAYKNPPLVTRDPDPPTFPQDNFLYQTSATVTGFPDPSWSWVINKHRFGAVGELPVEYGRGSRIDGSRNLAITGYDTIVSNSLTIHYEARNPYGAVATRDVTVLKPFISPKDGNSWDLGYTETINYTSGIVLKCTSYQESYPEMQNTWNFCRGKSCQDLGTSGVRTCPRIADWSSRKFLVEQGRKLVFVHMTREDFGCYVCVSENQALMESVKSTVTLITKENSLDYTPKLIHKLPTLQTISAILGEPLRLECAFQAKPIAAVIWYHNDTEIGQDNRRKIALFSNTLTIGAVIYSDEGKYECKGLSPTDINSTRNGTFQVHVDAKPYISNLESQTALTGDNVTLYCATRYNSHISWFKDIEHEIQGVSEKFMVSKDRRHLSIFNATSSDTGTYTCQARNRHGLAAKHAAVIIMDPVNIVSIDATISPDTNVTTMVFTCDARADPNLNMSVTWSIVGDHCPLDLLTVVKKRDVMRLYAEDDGSDRLNFCVFHCTAEAGDLTSCMKARLDQSGDRLEQKDCTDDFDDLATTSSFLNVKEDYSTTDSILRSHLGESTGAGVLDNLVNGNYYWVIGACVVAFVALSASIIAIIQYQKKRKTRRSGPIISDYGSGGPLLGPVQYTRDDRIRMGFVNNSLYTTSLMGENFRNQLREVEISRTSLELGEMIGRGQFGRVYKGYLEDKTYMNSEGKITVAIKTLKYKAEESEMVDMFLREALMMKGFDHPHVLRLIGITTDTDRSPLVVLPYMENGDLRTYISRPDIDFRVLELLKMGVQVANGMAYLSEKRFVHRDLAARNCMVDKQGIVRVADFGLSRDLYSQEYYRTEDGKNPLPIRWMAIESLDHKVFTTKSDVWSFGVLLWELVTRGATPYPGIENWALAQHLHQGGRMKQPLYCPNPVYDLMLECWNRAPKLRPSFETLQAKLESVTMTPVTSDKDMSQPGSKLERRGTLDMDIRTTKVTKCRNTDHSLDVLSEA